MDNLLQVKNISDLYGLVKVSPDQLVYVAKNNIIYHLKDISRRNKKDGWEPTGAVPVSVKTGIPVGSYLTNTDADALYLKLQNDLVHPDQTIYGNFHVEGNITASGDISAFDTEIIASLWDQMPLATSNHIGGIQLTSVDPTNKFLRGDGTWTVAGFSPTIHNLVDVINHPVSGLTAGHFLKALSPTTYGFAAISVANISDAAPLANPTFSGTAVIDGARPIELISGSIYIKGEAGGWAIPYGFKGPAGTSVGSFGAYGTDDTLNYLYIGKAYNDTIIRAYPDGAAQLYYDNALKLATTSTGIAVTGTITATGDIIAYN